MDTRVACTDVTGGCKGCENAMRDMVMSLGIPTFTGKSFFKFLPPFLAESVSEDTMVSEHRGG